MKNILVSSFRAAAFASMLLVLSAASAQAADRAAQALATSGTVALKAAGPYVNVGTMRIQTSAKLGRPNAVLPDGTWLYNDFAVVDSDAAGTLVVAFTDGRVSSLLIASPAVIMAMHPQPAHQNAKATVTAQN